MVLAASSLETFFRKEKRKQRTSHSHAANSRKQDQMLQDSLKSSKSWQHSAQQTRAWVPSSSPILAPSPTRNNLPRQHRPGCKHTELSEPREQYCCKLGQEHGPTKKQQSMVRDPFRQPPSNSPIAQSRLLALPHPGCSGIAITHLSVNGECF